MGEGEYIGSIPPYQYRWEIEFPRGFSKPTMAIRDPIGSAGMPVIVQALRTNVESINQTTAWSSLLLSRSQGCANSAMLQHMTRDAFFAKVEARLLEGDVFDVFDIESKTSFTVYADRSEDCSSVCLYNLCLLRRLCGFAIRGVVMLSAAENIWWKAETATEAQ